MTSAVPLVIRLLTMAPTVGAMVADRIEPEIATGSDLPRIVVRQASGRHSYGLAQSSRLREARVTVLCGAATYTAAEHLAEATISALKDIRHARLGEQRVTLLQDGEDAGSWDEDSRTFTRIIGFRVIICE